VAGWNVCGRARVMQALTSQNNVKSITPRVAQGTRNHMVKIDDTGGAGIVVSIWYCEHIWYMRVTFFASL
jgi:hypothetical protein